MIKCQGPCGRSLPEDAYGRKFNKHMGRWYTNRTCKDCHDRPGLPLLNRDPKGESIAAVLPGSPPPEGTLSEVVPPPVDPSLAAAAEETAVQRLERVAKEQARVAAAQARLDSDTTSLKPGDLNPDDYTAPNYDREKKQEYNENMGTFGQALRELGTDPESMAAFVSLTAEQERRWLNKRLSRSVSIGAARELLMVRQFEQMAARVQWPLKPEGYAQTEKSVIPSRGVVLGLSDLHIGANLPAYENPIGFNFLSASRRLARLTHECGDYKPQYRDHTELVFAVIGDIVEGLLGWNDADNAPFAEQQVACCFMLAQSIEYLAARYPKVRVVCQTGNHGRNKLTHPGRATSSKWNSQEYVIYKFLERQCRALKNVSFQIPLGPNAVVDMLGRRGVFSHGDTEHNLMSPSTKANTWRAAIDRLNSTGSCGGMVDLFFAGHFHDPMIIPHGNATAIANGALVPGNGHSRSSGFSSQCGQWLWEFTAKHAFGDNRFLRVGLDDDTDTSLDTIITPFESDRPLDQRP